MIIIKSVLTFVGLLGLLLLAFGSYFSYQNIVFYRKGILVKGKVMTTFIRKVSRGTQYEIRVDFKTKEGKNVVADSPVGWEYNKDTEVDVYYMPEDPEKILVFSLFGNWWLVSLLIIFGVFLCYLGFGHFFRSV